MISAIIVDDEQLAIDTLTWELKQNCKNVKVIFSTTESAEAVSTIDKMQPDVLFLDIEMPVLDGFQLLNELSFRNFDLIFTTAYDTYALKALKKNAVDYLLKPIDSEELTLAINKVIQNKYNKTLGDNLKNYIDYSFQPKKSHISKVALPMEKKIVLVDKKEILYCESEGSYSCVYIDNGTKHMISKNLKQLAAQLDDSNFIRIHQSYMVNVSAIKEYYRGDGGEVVLHNGKNIPVSRSKKNILLQSIMM